MSKLQDAWLPLISKEMEKSALEAVIRKVDELEEHITNLKQ